VTTHAPSLTVVTDLDLRLDEGMAVTTRNLIDAARTLGLDVRLLRPPDKAGDLLTRTYVAFAARKLHRVHPSAVLYIPRGGLTRASVAKGALLARAARGRISQLILQSDIEGVPHVSGRVTYLVLAESLAELIRDRGGSVAKVRLGVDRTQFKAEGPVDASMWPEGGRARILHVGHLKRERNVSALAELSRNGFSCLLVASPSTAPDEDVEHELKAAGVTIVRHHLDDLPAVYRAADAYLFPVADPRACTTMPLSVLEALACGTQVVSSPFGAVSETFANVPAVHLGPSEELTAAVERAAESPAAVDENLVPSWESTVHEILRAASVERTPKLVLLLGLDGTGKSTQSRLLIEEARERGLRAESVWARWDPLFLSPLLRLRRLGAGDSGNLGGREYLSWKRRVFRSVLARGTWRRAAAADHFFRVGPKLRRAMRTNDVVVCDRYYHDALIDMAVSFGSQPPPPVGLHRLFPTPHITLLLDANEEALADRKEDVPSLDYLRARRPLYLEMAGRNGWPVIDAMRPIAEVHASLTRHIWSKA
jgi:thymidylate kinase/glycosyltransferase involved in cell wall biosynthesis